MGWVGLVGRVMKFIGVVLNWVFVFVIKVLSGVGVSVVLLVLIVGVVNGVCLVSVVMVCDSGF